jgi:hypothetical protein
MKRSAVRSFAGLFCVLGTAVVAVAACSGSPDVPGGSPCVQPTQCTDGLTCFEGVCTNFCCCDTEPCTPVPGICPTFHHPVCSVGVCVEQGDAGPPPGTGIQCP